MKKKAQYNTRM